MSKKEKFDGRSRPSNETYRKRFNEVFKQEQEELDESYKQSLKNREERIKTTSELSFMFINTLSFKSKVGSHSLKIKKKDANTISIKRVKNKIE